MSVVKLDFDEMDNLDEYWKRVYLLDRIVGISVVEEKWESSESGNLHVVLRVEPKLGDLEVLCVQLILGSDVKREIFNLWRIRRGQCNWNILFEGKGKKERK